MILVITGNGKGKTTSAIGTAIRAAGWGNKVAIAFFDKGGSHYGEKFFFDKLETQNSKIEVYRYGLKRFDEEKREFRFENTDGDVEEAAKGLKEVQELFDQDYFLIVCDEIINCLNLDLIDELALRDFIDALPEKTHLILTGRNVPEWLSEKADLVSEVNEVKHYFRDGKDAIKGLDY